LRLKGSLRARFCWGSCTYRVSTAETNPRNFFASR